MRITLLVCVILTFFCINLRAESAYFPGAEWETVDGAKAGIDMAAVEDALTYAASENSSGVVILWQGRILAERYWPLPNRETRTGGFDEFGSSIEDVASVQKSVVSFLAGVAVSKGLLDIEQPVQRYLGNGWSKATQMQESAILVRHLMTMTSGLSRTGEYEVPVATRWQYNTTMYSQMVKVLEAVSGKEINALTRDWLTGPIGMKDSRWQPRRGQPSGQDANSLGFMTTARDLARFGLLMLREGQWRGEPLLTDQGYFQRAISSSQQLNPAYGYLWWLNGHPVQRSAESPSAPTLISSAPADLYAAQGALGRKVYVVPSLDLVVTRIGDRAGENFNEEFWARLGKAFASVKQAKVTNAPNIVLILADDLGIADVGVYGSKVIETPNIDALAASGVRMAQGYVSHPVCSPSRAGLLTGQYQQRHGWEFNPAGRDARAGMNTSVRTFADEMKALGYNTGMVGKWHLGTQRQHHPMMRGFDEYFGVLEGGTTYIDSRVAGVEHGPIRGEPAPLNRPNEIMRGFDPVTVDEYVTDVFTEQAVAFIEKERDQPFLLYLSHITPHTPLQATEQYLDRYRYIEDQKNRVYAAMVASLDDSVGEVIAALKRSGQYDNTLVVFLSDNGCPDYVGDACSNAPFSGYKRFQQEGGVRVPFLMSWPDALRPGTTYDEPVSSIDLLATFTGVAGSAKGTEDSVNLMPYITGEKKGKPHEYLFWRSGPTISVRAENWKLIRYNKAAKSVIAREADGLLLPPSGGWDVDANAGQLVLLYNLANDPAEQNNVAADHPDIVERLVAAHESWASELAEPILPPFRSTLATMDGHTVQLLY